MTVLNKKLLVQRTEKLAGKNRAVRETVGYQEATKVGILFSQTDRRKFQAIRNLAKQLKKDGKKVDVLCYLGKDGENFDFLYDYITSKDVSILGKIDSHDAISFAEEHFDYLLYLDVEQNIYLQNILAMSKAKCRIGLFEVNRKELLELMINLNGEPAIEEVIDQIFYYTKKLGRNGS